MAQVATAAPPAPSPSPDLVAYVCQCRRTIAAIEAAGGPPPEMHTAYAQAVNTIDEAERQLLGGDELGFLPLILPWLIGTVVVGGGAYVVYKAGVVLDQVAEQVADSTRGVVREVGKSVEVATSIMVGVGVFFAIKAVGELGKKKRAATT